MSSEKVNAINAECLNSVKVLMEKAIDVELLRLDPTITLENMDITEKVMYLEYLTESDETRTEGKIDFNRRNPKKRGFDY